MAFADRPGYWGCDLALHIGRMRCGLTLKELGHHAGRMGIQAVSKACCRMGGKLKTDKGLQRTLARVGRFLDNGRKREYSILLIRSPALSTCREASGCREFAEAFLCMNFP